MESSKNKKSFIIYTDNLNVLDELTDEQAGKLFKAIKTYNTDGHIELDGLLKAVFIPFKTMLDKNTENYQKVCERNRENGKKGGAPKGNRNAQKNNPKQPKSTQVNPNNLDNDNDNDNEYISNDIYKEKNIKKESFKKPTLEEVKNYIVEIGSSVDANSFFDYYESNGWKIKQNPMKDWKATLRGWERRNNANKSVAKGGSHGPYNPNL